MNTPVIIAARNEAGHIGNTLDVLSRQSSLVEPIVIVNGSSDRTADIVRSTGAVVLESEEGKMLAMQEGLRYLGKRALDPLLVLDADARPASDRWSNRLASVLHELPRSRPSMTWAPYVFNGEINPVLGTFFSATSMKVSWADRNKEHPRTIRGGNSGLYMKDPELLEAMLALPNYWPREDVAIFDTMKDYDAEHKVVFNPQAWVFTSGHRITDTLKRILKERRHPSLITDSLYASEAPIGSLPYNSETTETVRH